jgi:hypothetical protein
MTTEAEKCEEKGRGEKEQGPYRMNAESIEKGRTIINRGGA